MSVQSEITRINSNIASAYTAVSGKGGTLPTSQNSANLPDAIESIPSGLGETATFKLQGMAVDFDFSYTYDNDNVLYMVAGSYGDTTIFTTHIGSMVCLIAISSVVIAPRATGATLIGKNTKKKAYVFRIDSNALFSTM